ncbi:MAG: hypothetical protein ABI376_09495, partial [Caulobacteraceae bacterium]
LLAAAAGLAVLDASAGALLGFAVVALGLTMKARLEEGFLAEALGAESYGAYAARVPMLVPGLGGRRC